MTDCNDCIHISNTEEDQKINKYVEHRCNYFYIQVRHKGPSKGKIIDRTIYPCHICRGSKFVKRESV